MGESSLLDLLVALGDRGGRAAAVQAIAQRLGVESLLFLVRDPELGVLLPAPGLPQTLAGGPAWKSFVERCLVPGRHEGRVDLPRGTDRPALGITDGRSSMVLVGGNPRADALREVERLLPLLASLLSTEQECVLARAEATEARDATARATALATALEASRSESGRLNAQLSEAHQRKDEFLAMLGHELRNPLAAVISTIELLRLRPEQPADSIARSLEVMGRQLTQLSGLVADLLDVSRVNRGRIELQRRPVLLTEVLRGAVDEVRALLDLRRQRLQLVLPEEPLVLNADPLRLAQVFGNLLHNAAKYSDEGTQIALFMVREGDRVAIRIADQGIGIAADLLLRVFELFTQGPVSKDRARGGLGIGLTLVKTLVELHGGQVAAESPGVGRGSVFTVRLPLIEGEPTPSRAARANLPAVAPEPLRVLVVDDNKDAADSLAALLEMLGSTAEVAYSGETALNLAKSRSHDLVILDIGLPGMDGYEVARRMQPLVNDGARLVALTGYGGDDCRRESKQAGFYRHLVKPVLLENLSDLLLQVRKRT